APRKDLTCWMLQRDRSIGYLPIQAYLTSSPGTPFWQLHAVQKVITGSEPGPVDWFGDIDTPVNIRIICPIPVSPRQSGVPTSGRCWRIAMAVCGSAPRVAVLTGWIRRQVNSAIYPFTAPAERNYPAILSARLHRIGKG